MPLIGFDARVTWSDFMVRDSRPLGIIENASIDTIVNPPQYQASRAGRSSFRLNDVIIEIQVDRTRSWVIAGCQTDSLLVHEQGHYDITAIATRELYNRVMNITAESLASLRRQVSVIGSEVQMLIQRSDESYDLNTNHGNVPSVQSRWTSMLQRIKANPVGTLRELN